MTFIIPLLKNLYIKQKITNDIPLKKYISNVSAEGTS